MEDFSGIYRASYPEVMNTAEISTFNTSKEKSGGR